MRLGITTQSYQALPQSILPYLVHQALPLVCTIQRLDTDSLSVILYYLSTPKLKNQYIYSCLSVLVSLLQSYLYRRVYFIFLLVYTRHYIFVCIVFDIRAHGLFPLSSTPVLQTIYSCFVLYVVLSLYCICTSLLYCTCTRLYLTFFLFGQTFFLFGVSSLNLCFGLVCLCFSLFWCLCLCLNRCFTGVVSQCRISIEQKLWFRVFFGVVWSIREVKFRES